jgi:hypothetical protein
MTRARPMLMWEATGLHPCCLNTQHWRRNLCHGQRRSVIGIVRGHIENYGTMARSGEETELERAALVREERHMLSKWKKPSTAYLQAIWRRRFIFQRPLKR